MISDLENSLNQVVRICSTLEEQGVSDIRDTFVQDIYGFISCISVRNKKDRVEYFNKVFLHGKYSDKDFSENPGTPIKAITSLLLNSGQDNNESLVRKSSQIAAFFIELGRYYLFSSTDRKDIDISAYLSQIEQIKSYIETSTGTFGKERNLETQSRGKLQVETEAKVSDIQETDSEVEMENTLEDLLDNLNSLIGLTEVKKEVAQIINLIKVQKKGEEFGLKQPPLSLHLVFYGNPGTGKTTVARLLAQIYKKLGVLSQGNIVEVDRGKLVAGYVGQTAIKTQEMIDKAMGGILFIDEAYTLTCGKGENDFGQEAVDTILKAMEDHRDDFIVIVAGYPDLMREFIGSNPGLKSRFNRFINFIDYTPAELLEIFVSLVKKQNLLLSDDCVDFLQSYFGQMYSSRGEDYANGRDVRNYFEKVVKARANRLAESLDTISRDDFVKILKSDLLMAAEDTATI